jgi:hypothetical protein
VSVQRRKSGPGKEQFRSRPYWVVYKDRVEIDEDSVVLSRNDDVPWMDVPMGERAGRMVMEMVEAFGGLSTPFEDIEGRSHLTSHCKGFSADPNVGRESFVRIGVVCYNVDEGRAVESFEELRKVWMIDLAERGSALPELLEPLMSNVASKDLHGNRSTWLQPQPLCDDFGSVDDP